MQQVQNTYEGVITSYLFILQAIMKILNDIFTYKVQIETI